MVHTRYGAARRKSHAGRRITVVNNRTAPSLDVRVPTCPEWTLFDLVRHLGEGRRRWAAVVAAGPASAPPAKSAWEGAPAAPRGRHQLQEIALHTYDAQITVGAPRPLPDEVALKVSTSSCPPAAQRRLRPGLGR
jgi:hypothetical protein